MPRSKPALAAMILAVCLFFPACSRGAGKAAEPKAVLRLAYATIPDAGLVQIALAQGFFAAEGIAVKPTAFAFGKPSLEALLKGEADLATVAETPLVFAILGGAKIQIAAVIATSDRNAAIVANRDSGILGPGDLAGKTIAATKGTTGEFFLSSYLLSQGLPRDDFTIVDMAPQDMLDALRSGRVAAAATWNPGLFQIASGLGAKAIMLYGEGIYTENFCLAGDDSFLKEHPRAMKAFMRALLRAEAFIKKSPEKAVISMSATVGTDVASARLGFDLFKYKLSLEQALLLVLEDETRWAMKGMPASTAGMPRYLEYIYTDALAAVAPERVRLIR